MSGILDSKSRIIDAIITQEGRRQLAFGKMRIDHVAFTDAAAFYAADIASGSDDATKRLYLEAGNLPQDQITFESDDSGRLVPFKVNTAFSQQAGQLLSRTLNIDTSIVTGSNVAWTNLSGSEFSSTAQGILSSSIDNFRKLMLIGSFDELFDDSEFAVGPNSVRFVLNDSAPIVDESQFVCSVNDLESLFNDVRLSNALNFKYLPPINTKTRERIGNYPSWGRGNVGIDEIVSSLRSELASFEVSGFSRSFSFDPTSSGHSIIGQFFEIGAGKMVKLDVIHFGNFVEMLGNVFFIGKVRVDDFGAQSFVHLFTLTFE